MNDRQCVYVGSFWLAWVWLAFFIGGQFPEGWIHRWYSVPYMASAVYGMLCLLPLGAWLGEEPAKK